MFSTLFTGCSSSHLTWCTQVTIHRGQPSFKNQHPGRLCCRAKSRNSRSVLSILKKIFKSGLYFLSNSIVGCPAPGNIRGAVMQLYPGARPIRGWENLTQSAPTISEPSGSSGLPIADRVRVVGCTYVERWFLL